MASLGIGLDFGTSNSAVALAGLSPGDPSRVIDVDLRADERRLLRSVLFFPEGEDGLCAGQEAIERYIEEGDGRFLQSMKSFLHQPSFKSTQIRGRALQLEQIVAAFLRRLREAAEHELGGPISRAVFGRPAVFSPEPARDRLAEDRLREAARLAGFPSPTFLIEPIAAALGYEATLSRDEIVLVGDFGAGTSDFTLMRLGPSYRDQTDRRADVMAWSGVRVGGDRFDAKLVEHTLLSHFGDGSTYIEFTQRIPFPNWMTRRLLAWNELSLLRSSDTLDFLRRVKASSDAPGAIQNLLQLAEENLSYHLYRAVEATKRALSSAPQAEIRFSMLDIHLHAQVTRAEFDAWTAPLRQELTEAVDRLLAQSPGAVPDAVFLTGGTSKIPSVRQMFADRFGEHKVREGDAFTSVVAGLGRAAAA
jgi:hypothetical chaperone protein